MPSSEDRQASAPVEAIPRRHWLAGVWGNPLARSADRWQAGVRLLFIWVWLVALPVAAVAGSMVGSDALQDAKDQAHQRTAAIAVLTSDAPLLTYTSGGIPILSTSEVAARWTATDGSPRTGTVVAVAGSLAGATVPIWVDRSGAVVAAPIGTADAIGVGVFVGLGGWLGLGVLLAGTSWLAVLALDRGRRAEWDRDWARVAPLWQGQQ